VYAFSSHDNANAYLVDKMKAVLTITSSFIITFSLLLLPSVLINSNASIDSHQANESMNTKTTTTTIYGCESIDDFEYLHCDPFKSEFEGNSTL
jgi:hypothetical protein